MARIRTISDEVWPDYRNGRAQSGYHVYVVQETADDDGALKIGISSNAFWRLSAIRCGNPRTLYMRAVFLVDDRTTALMIEGEVLRRLRDDALVGEWVSTPLSVVIETVVAVGNEL